MDWSLIAIAVIVAAVAAGNLILTIRREKRNAAGLPASPPPWPLRSPEWLNGLVVGLWISNLAHLIARDGLSAFTSPAAIIGLLVGALLLWHINAVVRREEKKYGTD